MPRRLGLIYRKDKALSKAALGFIQVITTHFIDSRVRPEPVRAPVKVLISG
jgi:hypothetical protein